MIAYTTKTAAENTGIEIHTIEQAIRNGTLRAHNVNGHAVLQPADIANWISSHPDWV